MAKLNEDFLSGLVLHKAFSVGLMTRWLPAPVLESQPLLVGIAVSVVVLELWLAAALWVRRWFNWNFIAAVILHTPMIALAWCLGTELLELSLFTVLMWTLLQVFRVPLRSGTDLRAEQP